MTAAARRRLRRAAAVVLLAGAVVATGLGPAATASTTTTKAGTDVRPPIDVQQLDRFLAAQLHRNGIPALAIGIVSDGRVVHARGFGSTRGRPVTARTPFLLASASKPLTATAVMQLVDAGRVRLDEPVRTYVPELQLADPGDTARLTVRQLLTHSGALPDRACQRELPSLAAFVRSLRDVRLNRPGTYAYCSGNYNLLGRLVERVTGRTFADYMSERVFGPLAMTDSFATAAAARRDGLAIGHRWEFGLLRPMQHDNPAGAPSGYLAASAEDVSHFVLAQLQAGRYDGSQLLSAASVAAMQRVAVDAGDGTSYGLGWQQGRISGVPAVYHYGANYDAETLVMLEPQSGRGAVILMNAQGLLATAAFRRIEAGVARILDGREPSQSGLSVPELYGVVDAVLVALTVLVVLPLVRVRSWSRTGRRAALRISADLLAGAALGLAVVAAARLLGATVPQLMMLVPDLVPWVLAVATVLVVTGVAHLVVALRRVGVCADADPVHGQLRAPGAGGDGAAAVHGGG